MNVRVVIRGHGNVSAQVGPVPVADAVRTLSDLGRIDLGASVGVYLDMPTSRRINAVSTLAKSSRAIVRKVEIRSQERGTDVDSPRVSIRPWSLYNANDLALTESALVAMVENCPLPIGYRADPNLRELGPVLSYRTGPVDGPVAALVLVYVHNIALWCRGPSARKMSSRSWITFRTLNEIVHTPALSSQGVAD